MTASHPPKFNHEKGRKAVSGGGGRWHSPRSIGGRNEEVNHHPVDHVQAVFYHPGQGEKESGHSLCASREAQQHPRHCLGTALPSLWGESLRDGIRKGPTPPFRSSLGLSVSPPEPQFSRSPIILGLLSIKRSANTPLTTCV